MAKLVQICASENDLFGLDGDGVVYQYNFNTNNWVRLGGGQRDHGGASRADDPAAAARPEDPRARGRLDPERAGAKRPV